MSLVLMTSFQPHSHSRAGSGYLSLLEEETKLLPSESRQHWVKIGYHKVLTNRLLSGIMGLYGKELVWHTQSPGPHSRPNKDNMGFCFSQMHALSPLQGLSA